MKLLKPILIVMIPILIALLIVQCTDSNKNKVEYKIEDKNKNGVWDYYESDIEKKYSKTPNFKNSIFQLGKAFQDIVIDPSNALEKDKVLQRGMACLIAAGLHDGLEFDEAAEWMLETRDLVVSNDTRQKQYIKYNAALSGHMLPIEIPDISSCDFKMEEIQK